MTITFHAGRHSGSLDSELEHDDYELKLTRKIETVTEKKVVDTHTHMEGNGKFFLFP